MYLNYLAEVSSQVFKITTENFEMQNHCYTLEEKKAGREMVKRMEREGSEGERGQIRSKMNDLLFLLMNQKL